MNYTHTVVKHIYPFSIGDKVEITSTHDGFLRIEGDRMIIFRTLKISDYFNPIIDHKSVLYHGALDSLHYQDDKLAREIELINNKRASIQDRIKAAEKEELAAKNKRQLDSLETQMGNIDLKVERLRKVKQALRAKWKLLKSGATK